MRRVIVYLCACSLLLGSINLYILYSSLEAYLTIDEEDATIPAELHVTSKYGDDKADDSGHADATQQLSSPDHKIQLLSIIKPPFPQKTRKPLNTVLQSVPTSKPATSNTSITSVNNPRPPPFPKINTDCDEFLNTNFKSTYNADFSVGIKEKYKVSICTKVKNEAQYVEEWLLYNWLIMRVSHFYVYDDGSEDNLKEVLQPYISRGIVTYIYWNQNRTVDKSLLLPEPQFTLDQRFCIADCTTKYKSDSEWMAFWDVDEFVYLPEDTYVAEKGWDNVLIPWGVFGSSNHSTPPEGLVINNYRWRYPILQFAVNKVGGKFNGKVLYKSKCMPLAAVHLEDMIDKKKCVKGDFPVRFDRDVEGYPIHIKHYWSKSYEDYRFKLGKWQNAYWFREELHELTPLEFTQMIEKENLHGKYDVDMLEYVPVLNHALKCIKTLQ